MRCTQQFVFYCLLFVLFTTLSPVSRAQVTTSLQPDPALLNTFSSVLKESVSQYKLLMKQLPPDQLPRTWQNGHVETVHPSAWISGFYPGTLFYLYEFSKDSTIGKEAFTKLQLLEKNKTVTANHDLGFMMYCSYGNAWRLTGNPQYKNILVRAAKSLATRFDARVGCIKSWDQVKSLDGKTMLNFPVIIDNMMNLELLFFASKVTGESLYRDIAIKHAETTMANHLRPDYSCYHVVNYDPQTGAAIDKETQQGFSNNSTWSRGQAWGIYGFTMVYRETGNKKFLDVACKMADRFLDDPNLPADKIPYWDFNVNQPGYNPPWKYDPAKYPVVPRDASAAAITASALIELAGYVKGALSEKYQHAAEDMLRSLSSPAYRSAPGANGGFLLMHSSGGVPGNVEVDVPLSYADYYYAEALMRYRAIQGVRDTIVNRYKTYLFRTLCPDKDLVNKWTNELNNAGQWNDLDYNDKEPANWQPGNHLVRLRDMAWMWACPSSPVYHQAALLEKIDAALDHWLAKRYKSSNWWHNEIGVPRLMRDIIILVQHKLSPARLKQALEVMSQLQVHENYEGGNLIWCADLGLHYGALTGDDELINRCRQLIVHEIKTGTGEGIQPDNSFHQHGPRLQMYQYGKAYLWEATRVAWQCRGTRWAFPEQTVSTLTDFVTDGWQWMARGIYTVPGTMDRSASRKGELQSADIRLLIPFLIELQQDKAPALEKITAIQNGQGSLTGFRYFPYSDFSVWHRPGFSFFLKTISARTLATESINHENRKGKLLNSGDAYLIRNGREYYNLLPVWDWTALPGVTTWKDAHHAERKDFVGSVGDSAVGFSVMDYALKDSAGKGTLSARKFWGCYNDMVICLIGDIQASGITGPVYTALDQCRRQGTVAVNKTGKIKKDGVHTLTHVTWLHHAGLAYIPLQPAAMELHLQTVEGNWTTINASETGPVKDSVFMPLMMHDTTAHSSTGYVLALSETPKQAAAIAARPTWKIIRNDSDVQAVQFTDGTLMAAFYKTGKIQTEQGRELQAGQPCLILIKDGKITASDPSHKGIAVPVTYNNKTYITSLPENGTSASVAIINQ
jgi:chondroitin AC lyase